MTGNSIIRIENLTKKYRGNSQPAVSNLNLEISDGQFFGLLGPNGAGKTTIIKIMCGLLSPTGGDVSIGSFSIRHEMPEIREIIGVVPQDIALYLTLTARENLNIYGGLYGLGGKELKKRIDRWLVIFGLEKSQNHLVKNFSGGMKRRLNLIAGLLHYPKILFLDEPTVGIDVQSKNVICENLTDINRNGTTIIYTSHYLEEAENLCSHIAILDQGTIITKGTLQDIKDEHKNLSKLEEIFLKLTGKELRD